MHTPTDKHISSHLGIRKASLYKHANVQCSRNYYINDSVTTLHYGPHYKRGGLEWNRDFPFPPVRPSFPPPVLNLSSEFIMYP